MLAFSQTGIFVASAGLVVFWALVGMLGGVATRQAWARVRFWVPAATVEGWVLCGAALVVAVRMADGPVGRGWIWGYAAGCTVYLAAKVWRAERASSSR